jgi:ABC-type amino acid transport substrate-binding protein
MLNAALFLLAATAVPHPAERLRLGLDVRSAPWAYIVGRDWRREDLRREPIVSPREFARLEGLDVDVMRALEKQMRVSFEIVPASWFQLETGLLERRYDLMLGSWTPSPRTPDVICASPPYCRWGLLLVVRIGGGIRTPLDLEGHRIGHYRDASVAEGLNALGLGLGSEMVGFDDGLRLFEALGAGELDAAVYDSTFVRWYVATHPGLKILGSPLNQLGYHIGVRRVDAVLCERIGAAIEALRVSGELERIQRRWEAGGPH